LLLRGSCAGNWKAGDLWDRQVSGVYVALERAAEAAGVARVVAARAVVPASRLPSRIGVFLYFDPGQLFPAESGRAPPLHQRLLRLVLAADDAVRMVGPVGVERLLYLARREVRERLAVGVVGRKPVEVGVQDLEVELVVAASEDVGPAGARGERWSQLSPPFSFLPFLLVRLAASALLVCGDVVGEVGRTLRYAS
jgi:hypothetical protein